ncbi:restriction endonuclease [Clostridium botulinum C]|uniref:Restriction endonuclease n=2 Tax=Clostridium botulinum TaxID=1491 RepID=A0A9Q4TJV3_CLOBO|nr:Sau3AI family type II restriction endonuclease [Clostridium botulinum]MCD3196006.1 restriction endonuclease [Clostridium botulinum C]MCD3201382.1 restriction endonuclease [Clostridium botulinum C]MCD3206830.1 restriction endonuclease [Clostridium botulinum C]MCD3209055.1 restriction endonuclease [Clostridium botulinum C]MCD3225530.1 restriction endonuclease [Clostridium botulinum C]
MNFNLPYDIYSPKSIENYAKKLLGKSTRDILPEDYKNYKGKGGVGQLLEKYYFMYEPNSINGPDFQEAGVELKTSPFKINKSGKYTAKERLVLNIINYMEVYKETFETSTFWNKNKLILLVLYLYEKDVNKLDYIFKFVDLFQIPEEDLKIIKDDWQTIINKIKNGEAHKLSESDTNYLAACTKGANKNSTRSQPFSDEPAKQRAFSLKPSYMTYILNNYILKGKKTYNESIIKDDASLKNRTFEEYVIDQININKGKTINQLAEEYSVQAKPTSKSCTSSVALGMLGVRTKNSKEFEKANIKVKTIRINKNGSINESMSFPTFKFNEIINEQWETSELREMFLNTRYLLIIYKFDDNDELRLEKGMFWNIPHDDLEVEVRRVWERTVETIKSGIKVVRKEGKREINNLPGAKESRVAHVRPHGKNKIDTYPLPSGGEFTKQCFWLNKSYILEQIKDK